MLKRFYPQMLFWLTIMGIHIGFTITFFPFNIVIMNSLFLLFFQAIIFYMNIYYIFPKYFSLENTTRFILITAGFILVVTLCQVYSEYFYFSKIIQRHFSHFKPNPTMIFMRGFFWLLFIDMISTVFMMQNQIKQQTEQTQKIIADKLQTELKLLKAQINPHFMFNALNNVYSLSYMKSEKAPESILKLSQMLRYVIEECENENVSLKSEIEYIENYIAFQKMKSPEKQKINFTYVNVDQELLIPPMLFIPFIENAFKYSKIEDTVNAFINLELTSNEKEIIFEIDNSIESSTTIKPGAGTGLKNVKKRLDILFPEKHQLDIKNNQKQYHVQLSLKMK